MKIAIERDQQNENPSPAKEPGPALKRRESLVLWFAQGGCAHAARSSTDPLVIAATSRSTLASLRRELRHASSETENLDAVGDREHLRHVVADENDRDALVANLPDQVEHASGLHDAQAAVGSSMKMTRSAHIAARAIATD